ncbi:MAG TPA: protein-glutamate O-methyltransferase CheR [Clostridiales bacterium]|nr:protein-glutamate O-methyltransferase CheR [Clostridiales bacterium]
MNINMNIKDKEFRILTEYIYKNYGINLFQKKNLVEGRLSNIIIEKGFNNFTDYIDFVLSDKTGMEATVLVNKLTTNYTFFMREASHFEYFKDKVLPYLVSSLKERDMRVWSAGCSSGEEPYTLAMLLQEFFGTQKPLWDTKILATDISVKVLEEGERGIYSANALKHIPPLWKMQYFNKIGNENYKISSKIQNEVIFRVFNLMDEVYPFRRKFHTIFCRNVMIYFDYKTKINLVRKLYEHTEPGGYLFIGHSEFIPRETTDYKYIMPSIYRKGMI